MNETKTIDVLDVKGKKAGSAELPGDVFDANTNIPLIHQVVIAQLAAARQGTHAIGEVDGVYLGFGADVRVEGAERKPEVDEIHRRARTVPSPNLPQPP